VASDALKTGERQRVALTLRRRPTAQQLVTELVALTFVSGLVDAATYLSLGHIFAANQTGNIIVLGLALGGASQLSATASLASLASFVAGALFSGWAAGALEGGKNRWLSVMSALAAWLLGLATLTTAVPVLAAHTQLTVSILAVAMGMRTVTVQRLGIGGISTTVLTTMLATVAGGALLRGVRLHEEGPRVAAISAMVLGAASGAVLVQYSPTLVLIVATAISLAVTVRYTVVEGAQQTERPKVASASEFSAVPRT
jgi:uncharacterized membrane protein YoaK (UPF0700 family)